MFKEGLLVDHPVVKSVCIGVAISKGLLYFEHIDDCHFLVIKTVPIIVLKGLYVTVIMSMICCAVMH